MPGFRRITAPPELVRKPPANLNARSEMGFELRPVQPHEANELGNARNLNRPQPKADVLDRAGASLRHRIAFLTSQNIRHKLHHARISIKRRKRRHVSFTPLSQSQSLSREHHREVLVLSFD